MSAIKHGISGKNKEALENALDWSLASAYLCGDEEALIAVLADYIEKATFHRTNATDIFDDAVNSYLDMSNDELERSREYLFDQLN